MTEVEDLSQAISSVSWAPVPEKDGEPPWTGITFAPNRVVGSSKNRCATAFIDLPIEQPISVPIAALTGVVPKQVPVEIATDDRRLYMRTDVDTEMSMVRYAETLPLDVIDNMVYGKKADMHQVVEFAGDHFRDSASRMRQILDGLELPALIMGMEAHQDEMTMTSVGREGDELVDVIPATRIEGHEEFKIRWDIRKAADVFGPKGKVVRLTCGSGFQRNPVFVDFDNVAIGAIGIAKL